MPKKKMTHTDFWYLIQYQEQTLSWQLWVEKADDLLSASEKLKPGLRTYWAAAEENLKEEYLNKGNYSKPKKKQGRYLQAIYSMLVAYAIENLYKAILILQNKKQYEQDIVREESLPRELKTPRHDLVKLVRKLNLNIDTDEINLLLRLSRNSHWQGRYPVPAKAKDLKNVVMHDGIPHFVAFLAPSDFPKIESLISRIKQHIKDNCSKCWCSHHF